MARSTRAHVARMIGWMRELGATVIRAHYPLSPQIEEAADRDGILIWSEIPSTRSRARTWRTQAGWLGPKSRAPAEHPHQPEPSLGAAVEHRQRADDAGRRAGDALHRRRGRAGAPARPDPAGRDGGQRVAGRRLPVGVRAARRDRLQRLLRLVRRRRRHAPTTATRSARSSTASAPAIRRRRCSSRSSASTATATGRSRSAAPTSSSPTRPHSTSACSRASRGSPARSTSSFRTSPPGPAGEVATRSPNPPYVQKGVVDLQGNPKPVFETIAVDLPPDRPDRAGAGCAASKRKRAPSALKAGLVRHGCEGRVCRSHNARRTPGRL